MPVGGSFLLNGNRNTNLLPVLKSTSRPVTPSYHPIVSPKNISNHTVPVSNTIVKPTTYNSIIPTQSVYS
jgi:hypothetical protein